MLLESGFAESPEAVSAAGERAAAATAALLHGRSLLIG
jgi:hypothetical protein